MTNDKSIKTAVIFAGGVGTRMHSKDLPKQFLRIHGKPILVWTLEVFEDCPVIDHIVVVCAKDWISYCRDIINEFALTKVHSIAVGGETGQLSIRSGLKAAAELSDSRRTIVLIHDGVRPLIDSETVLHDIDSIEKYGSAITCVPTKETTLIEDKDELRIIPREEVLLARAPQGFWLADILSAHDKAFKVGKTDYIDSATLMSDYGYELHIVIGKYESIKITTQDDYYSMRAILDSRENNQLYCEYETE